MLQTSLCLLALPSLSPVLIFPTILPTDLSFQQTHPYTDSRGRVCSANAHLLSLQVRLGLLEPQLAANRVLEHPPGPGLRKARPGPILPPTAVDQTHGQGMGTPGSNPTMHCTSEREQPRGIKAPGPPSRDSRLQYCSQKDKGQAALGTLSLHSPLRKSQQSDSVFFSPCLSPSLHPHAAEPFHFNPKGKI